MYTHTYFVRVIVNKYGGNRSHVWDGRPVHREASGLFFLYKTPMDPEDADVCEYWLDRGDSAYSLELDYYNNWRYGRQPGARGRRRDVEEWRGRGEWEGGGEEEEEEEYPPPPSRLRGSIHASTGSDGY